MSHAIPLRSPEGTSVPRAGLPVVPLIGREAETALLLDLLTRDRAQLVTLLGPGGVGKTRLAMHVAARIERNALAPSTGSAPGAEVPPVIVVSLAPIMNPAHVVLALGRQVGVGIDRRDDVARRIIDRIGAVSHRVLVVIDNAEHLVEGMTDLAPILLACPNLTMLVTSRTVLRLSMEQVIHLDPLPVHTGGRAATSPSPAAQLFIERARAVHPGFHVASSTLSAVEDICLRLDGLPLAIELAAARSRFFSPPVLRARIDASSQTLGDGPRDAPARHRSLRELIAWSYALLDEPAQTLFRRLSAFADGASIPTLVAVTAAIDGADHPHVAAIEETIVGLVDHSLVRIETAHDGEPRIQMLRTIHDAAREMLDASGEGDAIDTVVTRHFQTLATSIAPATRTFGSPSGEAMTRLLHGDRLNLIAAVSRLVQQGAMSDATAMVSGLANYWLEAGELREGRGWIERILPYAADAAPEDILPLYRVVTILAFDLFDYEGAERYAREALEIERRGGDATMIAFRELMLGTIRFWKGEQAEGLALQAAGIDALEALGETFRAALGKATHGECLLAMGDLDAAEPLLEESHAVISAENPSLAGIYASALGTVAQLRGDLPRAGALFAESLDYHVRPPIRLQRNLIDRFLRIGSLAAAYGDLEAHARMAGSAAAVQDRLMLGEVARQQENYREAMAVLEVLGGDRFEAAWNTGHGRDIEASLLDALGLARSAATTTATATVSNAHRNPRRPAPTARPTSAKVASRPSPQPEAMPGLATLTPREREVLVLLASGASNAEIADRLSLSPRTVGTHLTRVYGKLDVDSRAEAVVLAIRAGITGLHED